MSGGKFDYIQYRIHDIAEQIQQEIDKQGKKKEAESMFDMDYYKRYPEEAVYPTYSKEVIDAFEKGIKALKIAHVYAHRIDWFLSGDDSIEESFLSKLEKELKKLEDE
jgi:hypothetical protein